MTPQPEPLGRCFTCGREFTSTEDYYLLGRRLMYCRDGDACWERVTDGMDVSQLESRIRYHEAHAELLEKNELDGWAKKWRDLAEKYRTELNKREQAKGAGQ